MSSPSNPVTPTRPDGAGPRAGVEATGSRSPAPARAGLAIGLVALAMAGAGLALLPHLAARVETGDFNYIADADQILYMAWSRQAALHGVPRLTDAVHRVSGPMMHPRAIFIPPAWIAHAIGADMRGLPLIWRTLCGAAVALGLYVAIRPAVRDRRVAIGVAAILAFDTGFLHGLPLLREADVLRSQIAQNGRYFERVAQVMAHLRVVPPGLALPVLLLHLGFTLRARIDGSRASAVGAAVALGGLFYVYVYFWTAVLAGSALAFLVDPKGRKLYASVAVAGLALGLPAVLAGVAVKASTPTDWMLRTDKFVPIGHFRELLIPQVATLLWLLAAPWVFLRRRELSYLWCCAGAAFACLNHQVVTGLQIENFHWLSAAGTCISLLLAALLAPWVLERRGQAPPRLGLLAALVAAQVALGLDLRWAEATLTRETRDWARDYQTLKADAIAPALPDGSVLAGDPRGPQLLAAYREIYPLSGRLVEFCSRVTDVELDERLVLNLFLSGLDPDAARREVSQSPGMLSWEAAAVRSEAIARLQRERRLALIDRIWADPAPWVARFGVTHVLLARHPSRIAASVVVGMAGGLAAVPRDPSPPLGPFRGSTPPRLVAGGEDWQLWAILPAYR